MNTPILKDFDLLKVNFHSKYNIVENGCWEWKLSLDKDGYGQYSVKGYKIHRAHRWSYSLFKSEIPNKLMVCHHCDNPTCVNPDHLFLGTALDNTKDSQSKDRRPSMTHPSYTAYSRGCRCNECKQMGLEYNRNGGKISVAKYTALNIDKKKSDCAIYRANNKERLKEYAKNYYRTKTKLNGQMSTLNDFKK